MKKFAETSTSGVLVKRFLIAGAMVAPALVNAQVVYSQDFESGVLDPRASVTTVGTFNAAPGIYNVTNFGSSKAFGFGLSSCSASCFSNFTSTLTIDLGSPRFISTIAFKEMELFDNWGSNGAIVVDGVALFTGSGDFGRLPYNDRQPDSTFRARTYDVDKIVTKIQLNVYDITRLSEIFVDDIVVTGVPEPATFLLLLSGLIILRTAVAKNTRADKPDA